MTTERDVCPACGYEHTQGGFDDKPDVWMCRNGKCSAMLVTDPRCTPRLHRLATEEEKAYASALTSYNIGIAVPDVPPPVPESLK